MKKQTTGKRNGASRTKGPRKKSPMVKLPEVLPAPLPPFAEAGGASPFAVAQTYATPEQVTRAAAIAGPPNSIGYLGYYHETRNPIWMWMSLSVSKSIDEVPAEVFEYFRQDSRKIFKAVTDHVQQLEKVRMFEGAALEEGVIPQKGHASPLPNISELLGWSRPGQNLIQSAGKDLRAVSLAIAATFLQSKGFTQENTLIALAKFNGRTSPETGPSIGRLLQMVNLGRKLIQAARVAARPK